MTSSPSPLTSTTTPQPGLSFKRDALLVPVIAATMDGRLTDPGSDPQAVVRQLIRQAQAETPAADAASPLTSDDGNDSASSNDGDDDDPRSSNSSAGSGDEEGAAASPPSSSTNVVTTELLTDEQISATIASIAADRQELATLLQHKRYLFQAQKRNIKHQHSLSKALTTLEKTRDELKSALRSLDVADVVDAEDQSLEVIRTHKLAEDTAATCPFSASMVQQIPLLRLQSIERAEYDNALGVRMWLDIEDQQLRTAVKSAAMKAQTIALSRDPNFHGDVLAEVAKMDQESALRLAEKIDADHASRPSSFLQGRNAAGLDWATIAARLPTRSMEEVKTRWYGVLRPSINTAAWSQADVDKLVRLATPHLSAYLVGPQDKGIEGDAASASTQTPVPWQSIARQLGTGRTAHACYVAYCSALVQRDQPDFTHAEDDHIKQLFSLFRGAWRFMALHATASPSASLSSLHPASSSNSNLTPLSNRTPSLVGKVARDPQVIYRRFRNTTDPALATGTWSLNEDISLIHAVRKVGQDNWAGVAARVSGRNSTQCRERWSRRLRQVVAEAGPAAEGSLDAQEIADLIESKKKVTWTKAMDDVLLPLLDEDFKGKDGATFVSMAKYVAERTGVALSDKSVRDRVVSLRKEKARLEQGAEKRADKGKRKESVDEQVSALTDPPAQLEEAQSDDANVAPSSSQTEPQASPEQAKATSASSKARSRTAIVPGAKRRKL